MRGIDWEVRLMKPRALNLLPLSLPRPRVFSESEWVGMGGMGCGGTHQEKQSNSTRTTSNIPRTQRVGWVSSISNHHAPAAPG